MRKTSLTVLSFMLCLLMVLSFTARGVSAGEGPAGDRYTAKLCAGTQQAGTLRQGGTAREQSGSSATHTGTSQCEGGLPTASKIAIGMSAAMLLAAVIASMVLRRKKD